MPPLPLPVPPRPGRLRLILPVTAGALFGAFALWPDIDIRVSALFHDPAGEVPFPGSRLLNLLRLVIWRMSEVMAIGALVMLAVGWMRRRAVLGIPARIWGLVVTLYTLGPGLMVDVMVKPMWARARPVDVAHFGGPGRFTPPHEIGGECLRNCSFVSGEVSGATALCVSLLLVLHCLRPHMTARVHRLTVAAALALPVLIALQRVASGRHFLSDAIFAVLFTLMVAAVLTRLLRLRTRTPGGARAWAARQAAGRGAARRR